MHTIEACLKLFFILSYRAIMQDVSRDNRVVSLVGHSGLRGRLTQMLDQLERCQKSLSEFLEVSLNSSYCL